MPRNKNKTLRFEQVFIPASSSGLARTHRIIRIENEKEIQFMKICSQIRLVDYKEKRSENQREERRLKRRNYYTSTIPES